MRRRSGIFALLVLAAAGSQVLRRARPPAHERVELFYEDGSMVVLTARAASAEAVLRLAGETLAAAR